MILRELQSLHVRLTARLISYGETAGYEFTWGETLRVKAVADANALLHKGISKSLHLIGLAVDMHAFKNGVYLTDSMDYLNLGNYWKSLHYLARWGGDFKDAEGKADPDGNHFSVEYEGRK